MADFRRNVRYLLWQHRVPQDRWADHLASWAGTGRERATELLEGQGPTESELLSIAAAASEDSAELVDVDLLRRDRVDLLRQNIVHLLSTMDPRSRRRLAGTIGVNQSTVHRWAKGERKPRDREDVRRLHSALGLPAAADLTKDALFLETIPADVARRRDWLKLRVDQLDAQTLNELFPAFRRLLGDP